MFRPTPPRDPLPEDYEPSAVSHELLALDDQFRDHVNVLLNKLEDEGFTMPEEEERSLTHERLERTLGLASLLLEECLNPQFPQDELVVTWAGNDGTCRWKQSMPAAAQPMSFREDFLQAAQQAGEFPSPQAERVAEFLLHEMHLGNVDLPCLKLIEKINGHPVRFQYIEC